MQKIFNTPKTNVYGGIGMIGKYIFMSRKYADYTEYFMYRVDEILSENFPVSYKSSRSYKLVVSKIPTNKMHLVEHFEKIDLSNNDVLYEISMSEFIAMLRIVIDYDGCLSKEFQPSLFNN